MNGASGLRRAPADAQFWFGEPLPEDALPPLEEQRNGHSAPGMLPPTPGDTRYPPAGPRRPVNGAPADRERRGPADAGPPSVFFTPVDPAEPPRWPTLADSPSLRVPPVSPGQHVTEPVRRGPEAPIVDRLVPDTSEHRTEPVSRRAAPADAETTAVIPPVPAAPPEPASPPPRAEQAPQAARAEPTAPPVREEPAEATQYTPRDEATRYSPRRRAEPEPEPDPEPESDAKDAKDDEDEPKHGKHRKRKKQPLWRELVTLVAVALLLTFLIQHFIGRVYSIPSGSMEQTLHGCPGCTGDRVFVDKMVFDFHDPLPGDVVVFQGPNSWTGEQVVADGSGTNPIVKGAQYLGSLIGIAPPDERDFVKRVIAIGGQTVECCDEQMRVMVDGKPLDEPYVYWEGDGPDERQRFAPVTVPEGTLWVMGDNRANSADSRIQGGGGIRGVVPITKVIGKVRAIVLPPSRWQGVGDHNPQKAPAVAAPAWQQGLPAGIGIAASWPVLWFGRRIRSTLTSRKAD